MPGPKPPAVELTEEASRDLETLVRRHSTRQQIGLRARIVLAAAEGKNNATIAREEGVDVQTARRWRDRWLAWQPSPWRELSAEERWEDLPRPGAPARIRSDRVCQIIGMVCEAPEESGRPISH